MAENGEREAQYRLGLIYSDGIGIPADDTEASAWMRKAAAQGSPKALAWLEKSLRNNPAKIISDEVEKTYHDLAEKGDKDAQLSFARFAFKRKNYPEAYLWLKLSNQSEIHYRNDTNLTKREMLGAIENASTTAQLDIYRKDVYDWRPKGFSDLEDKALKGDAAAAKQVAKFYNNRAVYNYAGPEYRERAFADAIQWQKILAEKGDASAQFELGKLYTEMKDKAGDEGAEHWYLKAASQGHEDSMTALGYLYYKGIDGKKDYDTALKWWTQAVETGSGWGSIFNMLSVLNEMEHIKSDFIAAYKWRILSRAYGGMSDGENLFNPEHNDLKDLKKAGDKMRKEDITEAKRLAQDWMLMRANKGEVRAQRALAKSYIMGLTGKQDLEEAYFWLLLSFQTEGKGFMNAGIRPAQIAMKLSPEQVEKTEKRLDDCLAAAIAPPVTP
ncbi:MAG: sel1 repeat family protein, partial [Alphaproteobacteria bacterium]|nr:sel1 repeat family protein [Alphaproteobacteria bacterium]